MYATLIDAIILVSLCGTVAYAWVLDRRVRKLMHVLRELKPMVSAYSEAVDRSERSLTALKAESARTEPPAPTRPAAKPTSPKPAPKVGQSASSKSDLVRGFFDLTRDTEQT